MGKHTPPLRITPDLNEAVRLWYWDKCTSLCLALLGVPMIRHMQLSSLTIQKPRSVSGFVVHDHKSSICKRNVVSRPQFATGLHSKALQLVPCPGGGLGCEARTLLLWFLGHGCPKNGATGCPKLAAKKLRRNEHHVGK